MIENFQAELMRWLSELDEAEEELMFDLRYALAFLLVSIFALGVGFLADGGGRIVLVFIGGIAFGLAADRAIDAFSARMG